MSTTSFEILFSGLQGEDFSHYAFFISLLIFLIKPQENNFNETAVAPVIENWVAF